MRQQKNKWLQLVAVHNCLAEGRNEKVREYKLKKLK